MRRADGLPGGVAAGAVGFGMDPIFVGDQFDNGKRGDPEAVRAEIAAIDAHIASLNLPPFRVWDVVPFHGHDDTPLPRAETP